MGGVSPGTGIRRDEGVVLTQGIDFDIIHAALVILL